MNDFGKVLFHANTFPRRVSLWWIVGIVGKLAFASRRFTS